MEPKDPKINALLQGSAVVESPKTIRPNSQSGWNANSYFAPRPHQRKVGDPDSPTVVAAGFKSSADLLRRLSLIDSDRPASLETNPQAAHPSLHLSGGIISASICIPHSLGLRDEKHWVSNGIPRAKTWKLTTFCRKLNLEEVPLHYLIPFLTFRAPSLHGIIRLSVGRARLSLSKK